MRSAIRLARRVDEGRPRSTDRGSTEQVPLTSAAWAISLPEARPGEHRLGEHGDADDGAEVDADQR